ncbi:uncharacterized protein LOC122077762 isoform X1 [Macadamia integrifolia]|uniref:uncharacterized protein LOC122077762 isoform X1 n=1 Tax=Macadamia integrifolia TaxID=60698 RepID=UPI001C4F43BC|nr:uncharacterized protein LOC122077762 isoform X1 [Macadamia integrifolia]
MENLVKQMRRKATEVVPKAIFSSNEYSSDDGQHATAVAAAAFAINSLHEAKLADEKKIREGVAGQPYSGRISRKSTSKEWKEDKKISRGRSCEKIRKDGSEDIRECSHR